MSYEPDTGDDAVSYNLGWSDGSDCEREDIVEWLRSVTMRDLSLHRSPIPTAQMVIDAVRERIESNAHNGGRKR
jgi:hypothetical protein